MFNIDFESLNNMGRRWSLSNNDRNKALGILHSGLSCRNVALGHLELPLAEFQDFLIALMPPIPCVIVLGLGVQE